MSQGKIKPGMESLAKRGGDLAAKAVGYEDLDAVANAGKKLLKKVENRNTKNLSLEEMIDAINDFRVSDLTSERGESFMKLAHYLENKPNSYFNFSEENFSKLASIITAFKTNGNFTSSEDLKSAKKLESKIAHIVVKSVGINTSSIGSLEISLKENPEYFIVTGNVRQNGDITTIDQFYFRKDGTVEKKEESWDHNSKGKGKGTGLEE